MKTLLKTVIILLISHSLSAQWVDVSMSNDENMQRIQMLSDSAGFVNSVNVLYKTTNAGQQWDSIYSDTGTYIIDFHFIDRQKGYLINYNGQLNVLMKTMNGGLTWTEIGPSPEGALFFTSESKGYVSSSSFAIHSTMDGGLNWNSHPGQQPHSVVGDIHFVNDSVGYTAGWYPGGMSKTTDGGQNWTKNYMDVQCYDIFFPNAQTGYVVGWRESISKTDNGGEDWVPLHNMQFSNIRFKAIDCLENDHCYVVGDSARVMMTENGNTFISDTIPSVENLYGVDMTDSYCYIVGDEGTIFRKEHGIILSTSKANTQTTIDIYPNPAQHSFYINTEPNISIEQVDILDSTGKRIKRFEGASKNFDVSDIPSGLYFLIMKVEHEIIVKKVVIK